MMGTEAEAAPETDALEMQKNLHLSRLESNVYNYDEHLALLAVLRKMGVEEELAAARERMAGVFPLTEGQFMSSGGYEISSVRLATYPFIQSV